MSQPCLKTTNIYSSQDSDVQQLWLQFHRASLERPGSIPDSVHFDFKKHNKHIVILTLIHGNETGSLPAVVDCINELKNGDLTFGGKITFILGNRDAFLANVRFIHEDLNRMFFDFGNITSPEKKRASEIASVIDSADFLLDLHQTIGVTPCPFYVCKDRSINHQWAQALEASQHVIVSDPKESISAGLVSAIEHADSRDIPALVIELSQMGLRKEAHNIAYKSICDLLSLKDKIEFNQTNLSEINRHKPKTRQLKISEHVHFDSRRKRLMPGWNNLQFVTAGTPLGYNEDGSIFEMTRDGYLLFPKYPPRNSENEAIGVIPKEIVEIVRAVCL